MKQLILWKSWKLKEEFLDSEEEFLEIKDFYSTVAVQKTSETIFGSYLCSFSSSSSVQLNNIQRDLEYRSGSDSCTDIEIVIDVIELVIVPCYSALL